MTNLNKAEEQALRDHHELCMAHPIHRAREKSLIDFAEQWRKDNPDGAMIDGINAVFRENIRIDRMDGYLPSPDALRAWDKAGRPA